MYFSRLAAHLAARPRSRPACAVLAAFAVVLGGCARMPAEGSRAPFVELTILGINDFHGNLEAPRNDLGGAPWLAAHLRRAVAASDHAAIVSAGDLIGATPLVSSLYHDEPTIEVANLFGLDFAAVGNHEFDDGPAELLRMQNGGPHPADGESPAGPFEGAEFRFLGANVIDDETGDTLLPGYAIERYDGIPVAFIGLTLEGTPEVTSSSAVAGLSFRDEAETINGLVPELRAQGVEAIVVVIHQGGYQGAGGDEDSCNDFTGPIIGIVERTDPAVDLFVTGHSHRYYLCRIDDRPVTSTGNAGRYFTDIRTRLDRATRDMTVLSFDNVPVTRDVEPAADVEAVVSRYRELVESVSMSVVGTLTGDFTREQNEAGESLLGGLIADAQLAATEGPENGAATLSFMNSGGIRSNLLFAAGGDERDGEVTYEELFSVHPFGNRLVTMTLTGAELRTLLEQQWTDRHGERNILMPSAGFAYTWSASAPVGSRVDPASIRVGDEVLDPSRGYRVTVNSFLADGGDGFSILRDGTERVEGAVDVDALKDYLGSHSPLTPAEPNRIQRLP